MSRQFASDSRFISEFDWMH